MNDFVRGRHDGPRRAGTRVVLSALVLGFTGCGGAEAADPAASERAARPAPGAAVPSEAQLCAAFCDRARVCGQASCADCPAHERRLDHLRSEYLWRLLMCVDGVACDALLSHGAWNACHDYALTAIQPGPLLRRFCFDSARRAARCGRADDADQSACLVSFRHVSDEALQQGLACLAGDCNQVPGCLARTLGVSKR